MTGCPQLDSDSLDKDGLWTLQKTQHNVKILDELHMEGLFDESGWGIVEDWIRFWDINYDSEK